jgi:hypothetical protein
MRKCLYFIALNVIHRSSFFKEHYEHKKKGVALDPPSKIMKNPVGPDRQG